MSEVPQPLFPIGTRVFTQDGRTGIVQHADFAPAVNSFRYILEGVVDIFEESELQDTPFGVSERLTDRQRLESQLVAQLIRNPGTDVRWWVGRELEVPDEIRDEVPSQPGGGNIVDALAFWATRGFFLPDETPLVPPEPPPVVPPPVTPPEPGLELGEILAEVDLRIAQAVSAVVENSIIARTQLEAIVMMRIVGVEAALRALEESSQETTGSDLKGLFRLLGTLVSDPLGFLLERAEDAILGEVADGLNR